MLIEMIGWTGDVLFVLSYLLVSQGKVKATGKSYNFMNLGGAVLFGIYATLKSAVPILILECFWGSIALVALYKAYRHTRAPVSAIN